ncbi:MAG: bifunctional diaminohydroxyphosphoribosylaminopyrimidine deaminase/5-amino-6-(5-phosphoribosylamino)uracil reductase RibD [Endomicrobia bacterium]|nr:bifunctional diaminohydroxyphosphoribosylaminopyrimidine deaminase/5-amino-6-(5-phosphoribosylamino)uracil reductase RibD [Endomicrobiia bacterium]
MNKKFMEEAVKAAKKDTGNVYPNPLVGCVIVKDNKIIAEGRHEYFGGNHAEINALLKAGRKAEGADMYVTLEPCNSYGKRPPCTQAIIKAGIKRVFFAVKDHNVSGSKETLEKAGVKIYRGLLNKQGKILIKDYLKHLKKKPKVTVKAAMTLDGKIATVDYDSKWITSQKSRSFVHKLRSGYDAVLVGTNTALKDNPYLTSHGKGRNPVRVIIDENLKIPHSHKLFEDSAAVIILCAADVNVSRCVPMTHVSLKCLFVPIDFKAAKKDFGVIINKLNSLGLKTILIEGGGEIISSALFSKVVDDIYLFVAPKIIGGKNAVSVTGGTGVKKIKDALKVKNMKVKKIGGDLLITGIISKRR